jgi:hypothetical protein
MSSMAGESGVNMLGDGLRLRDLDVKEGPAVGRGDKYDGDWGGKS